MGSITNFLNNFDAARLVSLLISAVSALLCITWHEISHGLAALALGDPTAKQQGRLSLNPIRHIDPLGLLMMVICRVGWAKPVPINPNYFRHPKRDIAITSLAGPASNFILAWLALLCANGVFRLWLLNTSSVIGSYVLIFFVQVAVLSVGLGIFNLIPISPLDGSKILFALLPNRIYYKILKYERYGMILMVILVMLGVFSKPLSYLITGCLRGLCVLSGFPVELLMTIL